jgi:hypothetical protein
MLRNYLGEARHAAWEAQAKREENARKAAYRPKAEADLHALLLSEMMAFHGLKAREGGSIKVRGTAKPHTVTAECKSGKIYVYSNYTGDASRWKFRVAVHGEVEEETFADVSVPDMVLKVAQMIGAREWIDPGAADDEEERIALRPHSKLEITILSRATRDFCDGDEAPKGSKQGDFWAAARALYHYYKELADKHRIP